ncbi:MAG: Hsp20/alpha crystallin family protein [Acidobacteria bacterium]|nr:MAG: Hsp20/alpha crystallin family protein [Acidobacteriota bacterium]RLE24646.1 MAG: Hsp20/alpha crystallin family protein [Acidobacteriota bacterium]
MAITKYNPLREMMGLSDRLNRMFEEIGGFNMNDEITGSWAPAVDVYESENAIEIKADLPGMTEKDIDVTVENNMLTIKGERKFENEEKRESYHRIERQYGSFYRSFQLPNTVDVTKINANFKNGILELALPKREETKPKKISINVKQK